MSDLASIGGATAAAPPLLRRAAAAEARAALATPAAKLLLVGSAVMAVATCSANLLTVADLSTDDSLQLGMHASTVAALVFSALAGAYATSTDLRFGVVEQRLLTDPSRTRWFGAKALVSAGVGLAYGILGSITAVITAATIYGVKGVAFDPTSTIVLRALAGLLVAAPLYAVIGAAVGALVRNQPLALGGVLVWMLVIEPPVLLGAGDVGHWLPGPAGLALTNSPDPALLGQVAGGVVLATYAVVAVALAVRLLKGRDIP